MRKLAMVTAVLFLFVSCKKTAEGETESWQRNNKRVQELAALYPSFKAPLDEHLKKATASWDAAKAVSAEEARIQKMAAANSELMGGFVGKLSGVDSATKNVRQKLVGATTGAADETDRIAAKAVADDAQRVLKSVEGILKQGAQNVTGANAVLTKVMSDLQSAERNLDRVIKVAKDKKRAAQAAKKAEQQKATQQKAAQAAQEKAAAPWKCQFCGSTNDPKVHKCKSCGAPQAKK